jgi:hypothetical protein
MAVVGFAFLAASAGEGAAAPDLPIFAATKVDGTDNVHIFRYLRHQSMFVVTPQGRLRPRDASYHQRCCCW